MPKAMMVTIAVAAAAILGCGDSTGPGPVTFAMVSAGSSHTCGVTNAGAAYCWGNNANGQLGDSTTGNDSSPVLVKGGLKFAAVSAGASHTCGVTTTGAAYCWGYNYDGELGTGDTTRHTTPVAVSGGHTFAQVSATAFHTCGVTTGGAAYCWGDNNLGQLGDATTAGRLSPALVAGGLTFAAVSPAGNEFSCGVTTGHAAYCWGNNYYGQLGDSTMADDSSPVLVIVGVSFVSLSAGGDGGHVCGVTTLGAAYCWGDNGSGQLGVGDSTNRSSPVLVTGGLSFGAVSAGNSNDYTCGLTSGGAAYCWGYNGDGELGINSTAKSLTPAAVSGGLTFTAVSAGGQHACALTAGGVAYCWGDNSSGQLGDGTTAASPVPVRVK